MWSLSDMDQIKKIAESVNDDSKIFFIFVKISLSEKNSVFHNNSDFIRAHSSKIFKYSLTCFNKGV